MNTWRLAFWVDVNMLWRSRWPPCPRRAYSCDCRRTTGSTNWMWSNLFCFYIYSMYVLDRISKGLILGGFIYWASMRLGLIDLVRHGIEAVKHWTTWMETEWEPYMGCAGSYTCGFFSPYFSQYLVKVVAGLKIEIFRVFCILLNIRLAHTYIMRIDYCLIRCVFILWQRTI